VSQLWGTEHFNQLDQANLRENKSVPVYANRSSMGAATVSYRASVTTPPIVYQALPFTPIPL